MALAVKFAKGVRNHWKKSTFAALAVAYGANYLIERNRVNELMRSYCERAAERGREPLPAGAAPRRVTVVLNPGANGRRAAKDFDRYCAPILNVAGVSVDVVRTESEGHARSLAAGLPPDGAVVVAGGGGTLSEVVTGAARAAAEDRRLLPPIGILPLGRRSAAARRLFPAGGGGGLGDVRSMADASLAVVEELTADVDVMRIETIDGDDVDENSGGRAVYAVSGIEWGAYRDAHVRTDSYWYLGSLRKYATYVFNGYKNSLTWDCSALLRYSEPCGGCANCYTDDASPATPRRWYHRFLSNRTAAVRPAAALLVNERCSATTEARIRATDLSILTPGAAPGAPSGDAPGLTIRYGPAGVGYVDFVARGWRSERSGAAAAGAPNAILARQVEVRPEAAAAAGALHFSIDGEAFEGR